MGTGVPVGSPTSATGGKNTPKCGFVLQLRVSNCNTHATGLLGTAEDSSSATHARAGRRLYLMSLPTFLILPEMLR